MDSRWQAYRRLRWTARTGAVIAFVGIMVVGVVGKSFSPGIGIVSALLTIAGLLLYIVRSIQAQRFQCPRCGEHYFYRGSGWGTPTNPFARRCIHCGLPKWASVS